MKLSQASSNQPQQIIQNKEAQVSPEQQKAAEGIEAIFASKMMDAMRKTVEPSEFSLRNSATDLYQGMLDQEYSEIAARKNSLGLAKQIIDYWLREESKPQYNEKRNHLTGSVSTGGTHESKSDE